MKTQSFPSLLERQMASLIHLHKLPQPEREYSGIPGRRFRFDFAWPSLKIALEVEGGSFSGGRHTRGSGFEADCEKYSLAAIEGWCVIRVTGAMIRNGMAIKLIEKALETQE